MSNTGVSEAKIQDFFDDIDEEFSPYLERKIKKARCNKTSATDIARLSRDPDYRIRGLIVRRRGPFAPDTVTFMRLAHDEHDFVKIGIAKHPDAPEAALHVLEKDANAEIRRIAIEGLRRISRAKTHHFFL